MSEKKEKRGKEEQTETIEDPGCPTGACDYKPKMDDRSHGYDVTPDMRKLAELWFETEYKKQTWKRPKGNGWEVNEKGEWIIIQNGQKT